MASQKYENARAKAESFLAGGIRIVFPAFDDLPGLTLRLGTGNFETADGEEYESALRELPSSRFRGGSAQDAADYVLNDPQSTWYEKIKLYEDVFEDSRITITEYLLTEDDVYEGEIILEGFLEKLTLSESDYSLSFSGISDMSRTGFPVGGRILSQRYCAARFNVNGLLSPLTDPCGWQIGQGGNPVFCTHKRTGADGCEDHNNAHRIVAVEGLTSAQIQYVAGGGIGGGGWEYGDQGPCFTKDTLVWMADGTNKRIWKVKKGESVWSFDPAGNLKKRKVKQIFRHTTEDLRLLDFGKNRLVETTAEHLFLVAPDLFRPAGELASGDAVRCANDATQWTDLIVRKAWDERRKSPVCNFHVDDTMTYFIVSGGVKIGVHNYKDYNPANQT